MSQHFDHTTKAPFAAHLDEFRKRLMAVAAVMAVGIGVGWLMQGPITRILTHPLNQKLYYTTPTGGLDYLMSISIFTGVIICLPVAIYNLLRFIEPASKQAFAHQGLKIMSASILLAAAGATFAYYVSLPAALNFLRSFNHLQIYPIISAQDYLSFMMTYLGAFAVIFQLPLIISFIDRVKPLPPDKLFKKQRWMVVGAFVIAGFATPTPDPINQTIMALPLIALYNLSVGLVWINHHRSRKTRNAKSTSPAPAHVATPAAQSAMATTISPQPGLTPVVAVHAHNNPGQLPNLRHVTDPQLLHTTENSDGRRRRIVSDIIDLRSHATA